MGKFSKSLLTHAIAISIGASAIGTAIPAIAEVATSSGAVQQGVVQKDDSRVLVRDLSYGLYEVVYSAKQDTLYVASAQKFKDTDGGRIYALDPKTLATKSVIKVPHKAFSLALDDERGVLFVGDTLDAAVTKIDLESGEVAGETQFATKKPTDKYYPVHPRTLRYDAANQLLYVTAVADPGKLYVVDTTSMKLLNTINDLGKWTAGLAIDPQNNRAYVTNFDGQVVVVDTKGASAIKRFPAEAKQPTNIALDSRNRLYVTDQTSGNINVFDAETGKLITHIASGEGALALSFDKDGKHLFVTNRKAGTVTEFDADSYRLLNTFKLGANPNSLVVAGQNVFVTVKQPFIKSADKKGPVQNPEPEKVVRITP